MRGIEEEDALQAQAAAAKRAETRAYIAAFLAQQQHLRQAASLPQQCCARRSVLTSTSKVLSSS